MFKICFLQPFVYSTSQILTEIKLVPLIIFTVCFMSHVHPHSLSSPSLPKCRLAILTVFAILICRWSSSGRSEYHWLEVAVLCSPRGWSGLCWPGECSLDALLHAIQYLLVLCNSARSRSSGNTVADGWLLNGGLVVFSHGFRGGEHCRPLQILQVENVVPGIHKCLLV